MLTDIEMEEKSNEELLASYLESRDPKQKQALVLRYRGMVKTVAIQIRGVYASFAEIDDVIHEGIIALMAALDRYDPSKNVKFESYASLRVRGAIIDLARKQDWVPRGIRKTAKNIDTAQSELYTKFGRVPTEQEMAEYLDMDVDKYRKALGQTGMYQVLSLDALLDGAREDRTPLQIASTGEQPGLSLQKRELKRAIEQAVGQLREKEQLVVSLYYRKELSMKEIAGVMGISEPRVSQIHASALGKLRRYLKDYTER